MTEALTKKKKIRRGHRASATRMVNRVGEIIAAHEDDATTELDVTKLLQLKLSLEEKLSTLKQLDGEILDLVEEEAVDDEIAQADDCKDIVPLLLPVAPLTIEPVQYQPEDLQLLSLMLNYPSL